jgi:hypothetical protein
MRVSIRGSDRARGASHDVVHKFRKLLVLSQISGAKVLKALTLVVLRYYKTCVVVLSPTHGPNTASP